MTLLSGGLRPPMASAFWQLAVVTARFTLVRI